MCAACTHLLSPLQTVVSTSHCTTFTGIQVACRHSMLCCPCVGQLTLSLEEQGQNLKVSMCYSAQGALSVCFTLPGGVVVAVHRCLAVNCVGIHWLQQNRAPLSAAVVMGQTACSVAAEWPNRKLPEDHTTCLCQALSTLACIDLHAGMSNAMRPASSVLATCQQHRRLVSSGCPLQRVMHVQ